MRLSELHPSIYHARIWQKRTFRRLADAPRRFASEISDAKLKYTCKKHQSLLHRKLGDSDPELQRNKVTNLKIAAPTIALGYYWGDDDYALSPDGRTVFFSPARSHDIDPVGQPGPSHRPAVAAQPRPRTCRLRSSPAGYMPVSSTA